METIIRRSVMGWIKKYFKLLFKNNKNKIDGEEL
jgi:hypothetical protein